MFFKAVEELMLKLSFKLEGGIIFPHFELSILILHVFDIKVLIILETDESIISLNLLTIVSDICVNIFVTLMCKQSFMSRIIVLLVQTLLPCASY